MATKRPAATQPRWRRDTAGSRGEAVQSGDREQRELIDRSRWINAAVGLMAVAVAVIFWTQRGYSSPHGGTWPDGIMATLAVLGLVLAGLALAGRSVGADGEVERIPLPALGRAVLLLGAWVATLPHLGYAVGGAVFFFLTALSMRKKRPGWRGTLLDAVVAVAVVLVFFFLFTEVLYVRLPRLSF